MKSQAITESVGQTQLSRRGLIAGASAAAAIGLSANVLGSSSASAASSKKAVVNFWHWYPDQAKQWPKLLADFHSKYPNITVKMSVATDINAHYTKLLAAAAAGKLPDVYAPGQYALQFLKQGLAADLNKTLDSKTLKDFYPSALSLFQNKGKLAAVGWMAHTMGVFWDPKVAAAAGVNGIPKTWDDLQAASLMMKKLPNNLGVTMSANAGNAIGDTWMPLLTQTANDPNLITNLDLGVGSWNTPTIVKSMQTYRDQIDNKLWQPNATSMDQAACWSAMWAGNAGAFYSGSWNPSFLYQNAPADFVKRVQVIETPSLTSTSRAWCAAGPGAALSLANNKNMDASTTFFQYLYSSEVYGKLMSESASMPATASAGALAKDPFIKKMSGWLANGTRHWLVGPAGGDVNDALAALAGGTLTPAAAAAQIQAKASTYSYK
jgi:multiple sugar transport system substrate-binding protein